MQTGAASSDRELFAAVFSDEPVPEVDAAIVVAHPGDEAVCASWLMARLQERASVYCLSKAGQGCPGGLARGFVESSAAQAATVASAALAGVRDDHCYNLGLEESDLARDLESLAWLTAATVSSARPRVLATHAYEGVNLGHDATCLAVHVAARMLARSGAAAPLLVELPRHGDGGGEDFDLLGAERRPAVRIEFGPASRKVKRRMLRCHGDHIAAYDGETLQSESYVLAGTGRLFEGLAEGDEVYADAPWCRVNEFRRQALAVLASFNRPLGSTHS